MLLWLEFLGLTAAILFSGRRLTRYGDIISERTGISRLWLGTALMAGVTSLPELATGLSAVASNLPDIAAGNILGSCAFNVLILGLLDALSRKVPLSSRVNQANILSAGLSVLFLGGVALGLFLGPRLPALGWVGWYTPVIVAGYFAAMRTTFKFEKRRAAAAADDMEREASAMTLRQAVLRYAFHAAVVVGAAVFLPALAERLAEMTGLGQTFVGSIFVAVATSLPEVTVSVAALRIGAVDMAVGNIFGSNLFNMLILAIQDIFYFKGPMLSFVSSAQMVPAIAAMAMTGLAIAGLIYNSEKKRFLWAWDSFGVILVYAVNLVLLYALR
ncbi:MAG: sodium:calcium antiporter [Acidobacteria bacterium]|jgi:cation:H+ antiporter|nr:sodium:calcium antiporter [Acidobacteriota bacterium]